MNEQTVDYNQAENSVDIRQYLALFWQWAWLIALAAVLAGGVAYIISKNTTPVYQTTTRLLVSNPPSQGSIDTTAMISGTTMTQTYSQMLSDAPVLDKVIEKLNLTMTSKDLAGAISVSVVSNTQIITVNVEDVSPTRAVDIANMLGTVFAERILQLQAERYSATLQGLQKQVEDMGKQIDDTNAKLTQETDPAQKVQLDTRLTEYRKLYSSLVTSYEQVRLAEAQTSTSVAVVQPAQLPTVPVRPKTTQNTLLAVVVGMLAAMGVIFAIDALDDTIRTPEEVTQSLGLPILAVISHFTTEEGKPIVESQPRSPVSEAFRTLRTNLQYTGVDSPLRAILVTSTEPSEGKTTVTVNLAAVFAQGGLRVTLIDADMRHPSIHKRLGNRNKFGLSSLFVRQEENLDGSLQSTRLPNLSIITAGDIPPNPSELLASQKMGLILGRIKEVSDMVLLDSPPIMAVTDASVLVPIVDGVLIVVQPGVTRSTALRQTVEQLRRLNANILGIVFNNLDLRRSRYAYRYYYYRGYYHNKYHKYYAPESNEHPGKKTVKTTAQEKEKV